MLQTPGVTERLAHFVVDTQWDDLKPPVPQQAKRSLMNFFAVALTGCHDQTIETALQTLAAFSGGKQATIVGRRERIDALNAAFLNAAGANVLDFCDTHVPTAIHPTAPVVPALLALAEMMPVSGRDFLLALVLGHEVECRIGVAMSPSHYKKGWHITSTCGVFGAAIGAGKLLGLSARQMVWALGTAATQSGGICECLGTPAKSVSVGNAARNGLLSALLASKNFDGPPEPLTGVQGYYHAMNETPDLSWLTQNLGETWEILGTAYKPYPCGFVIHPVLDCVLGLAARQSDGSRGEGRGDRQSAPRRAHRSAEYFDRPRGAGQHAACGRRRLGHGQSRRRCNSPMPASTIRKSWRCAARSASCVTSVSQPCPRRSKSPPPTANRIRSRRRRRAAVKSNPMSDKELEDKLRTAAAGAIPRNDIAPLIDAIWQLDKSKDISKLASLTVPRD